MRRATVIRVLRRLAPLAALLASLAGSACVSPTLPLPPPEPSDIRPASTPGTWIISGKSNEPHALIVIQDERTNQGVSVISSADTRAYSVEIEASPCDAAEVLELDENSHEIGRTPFVIEPTTNGFGDGSCP
jgi:hypothetical protein